MVISLDNKGKNARLSLRQTEILAKLNEIVDVICVDCSEKCVWFLRRIVFIISSLQRIDPEISPRVRPLHVRINTWLSLHWLNTRPIVCRKQYAIPVGSLN